MKLNRYKTAKFCMLVEATDLFCVVTGLLVGGTIALDVCTRRIPEEPRYLLIGIIMPHFGKNAYTITM